MFAQELRFFAKLFFHRSSKQALSTELKQTFFGIFCHFSTQKKEILMTYSWILNFPCLTSIDKSYLTFLCQSYWKFCSSNQTCIILHESYIARLYDTAVAYCQSSSRPTTFFFFAFICKGKSPPPYAQVYLFTLRCICRYCGVSVDPAGFCRYWGESVDIEV